MIQAFHSLLLFYSSLNGLPKFFLTEAIHSFTSHLQEELNTADLYSYRKVIDNISSCMENFNLGKPVLCLANVCHYITFLKCSFWQKFLSIVIFLPSGRASVVNLLENGKS